MEPSCRQFRYFNLTVAFGALKPAHRLMPAMARMGRVVLADIGIAARSDWFEIGEPVLPQPAPDAHKYSRGLVHCLAGEMPGAIALAATAAARSGAGYVRISTSRPITGLPLSVVQVGDAQLADPRIGCLLVGPGLGKLPQVLTLALTSDRPKVIDADAIGHVGEPGRLKGQDAVLTPHAGEFAKLFGDLAGSKAEQALAAARASGAIIVFKGPDTLVASPDGRLGFAPPAPAWLATAGTGDVLAGMIAALRARGMPGFEAACAGVWLHGRAAERAGPEDDCRRFAGEFVSESVVRIAARGDGVTVSGRHVGFAAPGDMVAEDGTVTPGPHRQVPPCRHFPACGGCQLQHVDDSAYREYLIERVVNALEQHGLTAEVREPHLSPPRSRRRATLRALKAGGRMIVGFNAEKSNKIIDLEECHILRPELFALVEPLRGLLKLLLAPKRTAEMHDDPRRSGGRPAAQGRPL